MADKKIIDLDSGNYMIVADLHGNLQDYEQVRNMFVEGKEKGFLEGIIFAGDQVHSYSLSDRSKEILDDMMALKEKYGDSVISLLGNHELSVIYNTVMQKGNEDGDITTFGEDLQHGIKDEREKYINFLKSFAIAVRTKGGVIINHAGPTDTIDYFEDEFYKNHLDHVKNIDHDTMFEENKEIWEGLDSNEREQFKKEIGETLETYYEGALEKFLAIKSSDKDRKEYLALGTYFVSTNVDGKWLRDMLTNTNLGRLKDYLKAMGDENYKLNMLIQGHIHPESGVAPAPKDNDAVCFTTSEGVNALSKKLVVIDAEKKYTLEEIAGTIFPLYQPVELVRTAQEVLKFLDDKLEKHSSLRKKLKKDLVVYHEETKQEGVNITHIILDKTTNETFADIISILDSRKNISISKLACDGKSYTIDYEDRKQGFFGTFRVEGKTVAENFGIPTSKLIKEDSGFKFRKYKGSILTDDSKAVISIPKKKKASKKA